MIRPFDEASAHAAAEILRAGGLVAFPTETVYGLGARADVSSAVLRIYEAKGRPLANPSIVHARDADEALAMLAPHPLASALAARFWPGPLTLVAAPRPGVVAREVMAGGDTLAIRVPAHPAAQRLLTIVDLPIAAPSANRSNAISPTTAAHVQKSLGARVPLILDAGPTGFGIESTIVDLSSEPPRLLRRGSIAFEELARVLPGLVDRGDTVTERPLAPGNYARHYAPDAPLSLLERAELPARVAALRAAGMRVGVLVVGAAPAGLEGASPLLSLPENAAAYAAGLYAALHALDESGAEVLLAESPPDVPAWRAVHDRLRRASHALG
ncbi:MAG: L-threonylcarbamoyladenylate synthase [Polyangiaceae bacterium]